MKGVRGVWKDLLQSIVDKGDAGTLLTAIQSIPALARAERDDPRAFWRRAFSKYFGEYMGIMDLVESIGFKKEDWFWRKITLWMTLAHRVVLRELEESRAGIGFIVRTQIDNVQTKDYTRVRLFDRVYSVPDFVRNVMKIESGQLLNMKPDITSIPNNQDELVEDAVHAYWTFPFSFLIAMHPKFNKFVFGINNESIIAAGQIQEQDVKGIAQFLSATMRILSDYNKYIREFRDVFGNLADVPRKAFGQNPNAIYLGKCVQCDASDTKLFACGNCHSMSYCSQECANAHWNSKHKSECHK